MAHIVRTMPAPQPDHEKLTQTFSFPAESFDNNYASPTLKDPVLEKVLFFIGACAVVIAVGAGHVLVNRDTSGMWRSPVVHIRTNAPAWSPPHLPSFENAEIDLHGQFYTSQAPVQAWGTVAGRRFYFQSRYNRWSFSVSESSSVEPRDIRLPGQGFYREEKYGTGPFDASYMPLTSAALIIERCAREYVDSKPN